MRHHDRNRKLGRVKRQREALLRSLAQALLLSGGIVTTTAKAKELRPFVERLITTSKHNNLVSRRRVERKLHAGDEVAKKMSELGTRYAKRSGGYIRLTQLGRVGKRAAEMTRIELVQ